jgi:hypothetical protein
MNILTDILSLFKRKQIIDQLTPDDLIVVGRHEQPDMLGIASPIPYKSVKLIKAKDLTVTSVPCGYANLDNGNAPRGGSVYINTTSNPCTINLRRIVGIGNNIGVQQNNNQIEIFTAAEVNMAENLGTGVGVYTAKVGETLQFKSIKSANNTINVTVSPQNHEIRLSLNKVILNSPDGGMWEVTVNNAGQLVTSLIG